MYQNYIKYLWQYRMGMADTLDILYHGDKRLIGLALAKGCAGLSEIQFAIDGREFNEEWYKRIDCGGYADALFTFIGRNFPSFHSTPNNSEELKDQVKALIRGKSDIAIVPADSIPEEIYPVYIALYAMHGGGKIFPIIRASMWKRFAKSYTRFVM